MDQRAACRAPICVSVVLVVQVLAAGVPDSHPKRVVRLDPCTYRRIPSPAPMRVLGVGRSAAPLVLLLVVSANLRRVFLLAVLPLCAVVLPGCRLLGVGFG